MRLKHISRLGLLALLSLGLIPTLSRAQDAGATRIATANPAKIFVNMAERKELMTKLESERTGLAADEKSRLDALKSLEQERKNLQPGTPQYESKSAEIVQKTIELQTWREVQKAELQRQQKLQMKTLYDKIQKAVQTLAATENYDMVLAEQSPEFPEDLDAITVENLRNIINSRNVLYAKRGVDISDRVINALDAAYAGHR
jgi:Skp family chaperone for outer membrane proteins